MIAAWRIRQMEQRGAIKPLLLSAQRRKFTLVLNLRDLVRRRNAIRETIWKNSDTGSPLVRPPPPPPPPPFPTAATNIPSCNFSEALFSASFGRALGADKSDPKPETHERGVQTSPGPETAHATNALTTLSDDETTSSSNSKIQDGEPTNNPVDKAKESEVSTHKTFSDAINKMEERLRDDFRALQSRNEELERLLKRVLVRLPPSEDQTTKSGNSSYNDATWRIHM